MTREEILAMQAGREMDVLVAEKTLGLTVVRQPEPDRFLHGLAKALDVPKRERATIPMVQVWRTKDGKTLPRYSKDIAAAWQVVNTLLGRGCNVEMTGSNDGWCVAFETARTGVAAHGATAAEAICRAALLLEEVDAA